MKAFTDWMNLVSKSVKPQKISQTEWYGMNIIVYMPLYFKNGKVKRIDISNLIKYAEDAICKKVVLPDGEFDDSRIIEVTAVKQDSTELKTTIQVYTIPD